MLSTEPGAGQSSRQPEPQSPISCCLKGWSRPPNLAQLTCLPCGLDVASFAQPSWRAAFGCKRDQETKPRTMRSAAPSDASRPWVRDVLPVRVARSALAPNVPHSDLYVSQLHAIFTDGVLVRVGSLVNATTITLHDDDGLNELEYYHIKLQSHDVIYAEGAPCETVDEVKEAAVNFVEYLWMYGAPSGMLRHCVPVLSFTGNRSKMKSHLRSALSPLVDRREKIDIIRDRLEDRALTMA
jgi:Hint domain